jgi:hypothetical protein
MTERFWTCLACGQRRGTRAIDLMMIGGVPLAVARCLRCVAQDKAGTQLIARLARREEKPR